MASLVYGRSATYVAQQADDQPIAIKRGPGGHSLTEVIVALSAAVDQKEAKLPLQSFEYRPQAHYVYNWYEDVYGGHKLGETVQPGALTELHFAQHRNEIQLGWGLVSLQHLSGLRSLTTLSLNGDWDRDATDVLLPLNLSQLVLSFQPGNVELVSLCVQQLSSLVELQLIYGDCRDDFNEDEFEWDDPPSIVTQLNNTNSRLSRLLLEDRRGKWFGDELNRLCRGVTCLQELCLQCDEQLPLHFGPVLCQAANLTSFSLGLSDDSPTESTCRVLSEVACLSNLQHLGLNNLQLHDSLVSQQALTRLLCDLPSLKSLTITPDTVHGIDDGAIFRAIEALTRLTKLHFIIEGVQGEQQDALYLGSCVCSMLGHMPQLIDVKLEGIIHPGVCFALGGMRQLTRLEVPVHSGRTDAQRAWGVGLRWLRSMLGSAFDIVDEESDSVKLCCCSVLAPIVLHFTTGNFVV